MKLHEFVTGLEWRDKSPVHDPALPEELAHLFFSNPAIGRYLTAVCRTSLWCQPDFPAISGLAALIASYQATDNSAKPAGNRYPVLMMDYSDGRALAAAFGKADPGPDRHIVITAATPHTDFAIAQALFQGQHPDSIITLNKSLDDITGQGSGHQTFSAVVVTGLEGDVDDITTGLDQAACHLAHDGMILIDGPADLLAETKSRLSLLWPDQTGQAIFDYGPPDTARSLSTCQPRRQEKPMVMPKPDAQQPAWQQIFAHEMPSVQRPEDLTDYSCWHISPPAPLTYTVNRSFGSGPEPVAPSRQASGQTYPQWLARFDNCQVIGHSAILSKNGKILCDLLSPANPHRLMSMPPGNAGFLLDNHLIPVSAGWQQPDFAGKTRRHIDEPVLVADRLIGTDYTHFLSEIVSRLVFFDRADWPDMKLLLVNKLRSHHWEILDTMGISRDQIIEYDPDTEILECRQAYAASWLSVCNAWLHPDAVAWYGQLPARLGLSPDLPQNRRIYLSRGTEKSWTRKLLNEDDLLPVFEQYGFDIINPENLGFQEKVALFYQAEAVAGSYTGGMMHCLFCRPDTKIAVFPTTNFPALGSSVLASMLDLEERTIIGTTIEARTNKANSHFVVDEVALRAALDDLGL